MLDPQQVALQLLGPIDWQSEVSGFCRCPGEPLHTSANGEKDCRVNIDGAPTIFCFHASCAPAVAVANHKLRSNLGSSPWEIMLPGGAVLRSGDVLQGDGTVLQASASAGAPARHAADAERAVLENVRVAAERFKPELFGAFHWPMERMLAESPLKAGEREPEEQFRAWLKLWSAHSTVWIGDVYSSGKPEHRTHFRPVAEWYQIGPVLGNFTCGSAFKPGSYQRSNETIDGHRFLVLESDTLSRDEVGAVFAYVRRRLRYKLHCIIDTAGKSLHAWFDAPRNPTIEARLKAGLQVFGCDPKVFTYSQPVRVPGAFREGRLQKLIWLRE